MTFRQFLARHWDRVLFYFGLGTLFLAAIFYYGLMVGEYKMFPYRSIAAARSKLFPPERYPNHLMPARYSTSGARIHDAKAMAPGVTLITSYWRQFDWKPGIVVIDAEGNILHEWKTDPAEIYPESPYTDHVANTKNRSENYVHGAWLFENGDVLFNIEYLGLIRMNAQGRVLWKTTYRTHHSVHRDDAGNFWVCGMKWIENNPQGLERTTLFPGQSPPFVEDIALQVSPDGKILREISVLQALYNSGYEKQVRQYVEGSSLAQDVLHTNDVEALPAAFAGQFPLFNAGDLLISCRRLSGVFVIDIKTERVKWMSREFVGQHDPDFTSDGHVRVFDNNRDGTYDGKYARRSEILDVKPGEDTVRRAYPTTEAQVFYTLSGGKAQELSNGNLLITEAGSGRVFEVNRAGETVWEWIAEPYNSRLVPEVLEGTRYPFTPQQVADWGRGRSGEAN